tara:strand:+ start:2092 stop:2970 length:879 start_codon:yes stop_codon:yes gene_type:complete
LNLEYDKIVVGSSLHAVMFAFNNNYPIFFTCPERPFKFDYFETDVDFSFLKIPKIKNVLNTSEGELHIGTPKHVVWERLLFLLSLNGNVPLSDMCKTIRWDGNSLMCSNDYKRILDLSFETCYFFGDDGCQKLVDHKNEAELFYVYDWIAFNSGGKHDMDLIQTKDSFVSKIWFYPSDRIHGNTAVKDACAISTLSKEQIIDFDFSETMARFKTIYEMESRGMKGLLSSYDSNGKAKHYNFKTSTITRDKIVKYKPDWSETDRFKKPPYDIEYLIANLDYGTTNYKQILRRL